MKFQFPSNGKLHSNFFSQLKNLSKISFNSLQTGNCIQTKKMSEKYDVVKVSFNSLQTGNCIQTYHGIFCSFSDHWFQFPSNGKLHSNLLMKLAKKYPQIKVSIPFKRETAFKPSSRGRNGSEGKAFQFPSNGKLHSNPLFARTTVRTLFRFQFPSNGKLHSNPYLFRSSLVVAPYPPNQTRIARRFFAVKIKR